MKRFVYEWLDSRGLYVVRDIRRGHGDAYSPLTDMAMATCTERDDAEAIVDALNASIPAVDR